MCERDSIKHNYILRTLLNAISEEFTELREEISQKEKPANLALDSNADLSKTIRTTGSIL